MLHTPTKENVFVQDPPSAPPPLPSPPSHAAIVAQVGEVWLMETLSLCPRDVIRKHRVQARFNCELMISSELA